jgi:hypothetical protein
MMTGVSGERVERDRDHDVEFSVPVLEGDGALEYFFALKVSSPRSIPVSEALTRRRGPYLLGRQVHGDTVMVVDSPAASFDTLSRSAAETPADALLTNRTGIGVAVVTADCVPILLYDPGVRVVGAVHAGWRGTFDRILEKTVVRMAQAFGSKALHIRAALGPAIRPCCYEVGGEVFRRLIETTPGYEPYWAPDGQGKGRLDLIGLNRMQLTAAGVPAAQIEEVPLCTSCRPDLFFSYRRDGIGAGRMVSGIRMKAAA